MTDLSEPVEETSGSGGKKGLLIGLLAALVLGAGGFYATFSGMIGGADSEVHPEVSTFEATDSQIVGVAFIPLEPLIISLGHGATNRYLRFTAQLEIEAAYQEEVQHLLPRVMDVLNGYLRAVDSRDIENPSAMGRMRAQILRRVQVVTGQGRVRDLLITEFVLN